MIVQVRMHKSVALILFAFHYVEAIIPRHIEPRTSTRLDAETQQPLQGHEDRAHREAVKVFTWGPIPIYTINAMIGSPPQPFSLALDLQDSYIFVPSSDCNPHDCDERYGYNYYNSSKSSTYEEDGRKNSIEWSAVDYTGVLSRDAVHVDSFTLSNILFEEWVSAFCRFIGCMQGGYDGVLGLAPPWFHSQTKGSSPTSEMLSQKVFDDPVFSLTLPRTEDDEGELMFGDTNPQLYEGPLHTLPVKRAHGVVQENYIKDRWTIGVEEIRLNAPTPLSQQLSSNWTALIDTGTPWLILPSELARNISKAIGAKFQGPYETVECEHRQRLPTLTFSLGGHDFNLSAFDYVHEATIPNWTQKDEPDKQTMCILAIMPIDEFGFGDKDEMMVFGSPFLKGLYVAFDMQDREIMCMSPLPYSALC